MAIGWFICNFYNPYPARPNVIYLTVNQFNDQINADGGKWNYVEVLGGVGLAKVRASETTLNNIANFSGTIRLPSSFVNLIDSLAALTQPQYNAIRNKLNGMGYPDGEIDLALGTNINEWRTKTLEDLLNLINTRCLEKRFNVASDTIVWDGPFIPTGKTIKQLDSEVTA